MFLTTIWGTGIVFTWLLNITSISALLVWVSIGAISISFRAAYKTQGRFRTNSRSSLSSPLARSFSGHLCLSQKAAQRSGRNHSIHGYAWSLHSSLSELMRIGTF